MPTHQMQQVEELCDRILLINHGRNVLYGNLDDIRHRFSGRAVLVRAADKLPTIPEVKTTSQHPHEHAENLPWAEMVMKRGTLLRELV